MESKDDSSPLNDRETAEMNEQEDEKKRTQTVTRTRASASTERLSLLWKQQMGR